MTTEEDIIDMAYSKGIIHPQPCSQCGVVECATCLDEVKKLLKHARADERKKIAKELRYLYPTATFTELRIKLRNIIEKLDGGI